MRTLTVLFCLWLTMPLHAAEAGAPPRVLASIEPLAMLLRDVFGDAVTVDTFLLSSQTPHDASFTPGQARKVQQADLIVWLGEAAEPSLAKLMSRGKGPQLAMLALPGIHQRQLQDADDDHDHAGHDHQNNLDPHLWLSPDNMIELARALPAQAATLGLDPQQIQQQVARFETRLNQQRVLLQQQLAPYADKPYLSHHDAWGYFAEAFNLRPVLPVSASTELSPGSKRFIALIRQIETDNIRCFMAEPESRRALAERLCRDQCRVVEADPLGRGLGKVGYAALLDDLSQRFIRCLTP
ncbi:MAG: zinc ABC transporter substrate-binding protein [Alcanivoracaceae bacterium]|nr:zinc ABC transporter substrate-binding protein [Alcanivoracaceae bacterium]